MQFLRSRGSRSCKICAVFLVKLLFFNRLSLVWRLLKREIKECCVFGTGPEEIGQIKLREERKMRVFSKNAALMGAGLMVLSLSTFGVAQDAAPGDGQGNQDIRQRMRERLAQQRNQQGGGDQQQADAPGGPGGPGGQRAHLGERGQRGPGGQGGMRFDPENMWENFMADRFKEDLKCSDDEWTKLGPLVKKVVLGEMELRMAENSGMIRGLMGGGRRGGMGMMGPGGPGGQQAGPGGPGGPGGPFGGGEQLKEEQDLQALLDQPTPADAEIEAKIKALRDARQAESGDRREGRKDEEGSGGGQGRVDQGGQAGSTRRPDTAGNVGLILKSKAIQTGMRQEP